MDGSPSVSDVYLRRDTAVSGAFLQRRKKPHIVTVASPALAYMLSFFFKRGSAYFGGTLGSAVLHKKRLRNGST